MENFLNKEYEKESDEYIDYKGLSFNENSFEQYLTSRIKHKFDDSEWTNTLVTDAVKLTGFSADNFISIFENKENANSWRIGELVAECILEDEYSIRFYYNSSRDSKNLRSNLTGADLVGFCDIEEEICFLFGEVKTSDDSDTPPNVMYSKTGMINQIENLRDNTEKRDSLVKWLFSKARLIEGEFLNECTEALKTYVRSKGKKLGLIGVLVRDTEPNEKDLKSRAKHLKKNDTCAETKVRLLSLYTKVEMQKNNWENIMNRGE